MSPAALTLALLRRVAGHDLRARPHVGQAGHDVVSLTRPAGPEHEPAAGHEEAEQPFDQFTASGQRHLVEPGLDDVEAPWWRPG